MGFIASQVIFLPEALLKKHCQVRVLIYIFSKFKYTTYNHNLKILLINGRHFNIDIAEEIKFLNILLKNESSIRYRSNAIQSKFVV